mmetsp:Transcript_34916/g.109721  ORF Transcript_34916/g.109721 Transcript_34916/m.109721 type:complete len:214 (-) Transcript_34916:1051-1692(-)
MIIYTRLTEQGTPRLLTGTHNDTTRWDKHSRSTLCTPDNNCTRHSEQNTKFRGASNQTTRRSASTHPASTCVCLATHVHIDEVRVHKHLQLGLTNEADLPVPGTAAAEAVRILFAHRSFLQSGPASQQALLPCAAAGLAVRIVQTEGLLRQGVLATETRAATALALIAATTEGAILLAHPTGVKHVAVARVAIMVANASLLEAKTLPHILWIK